jgi:bifunctional non-homologous end joining protein LigD
MDEPMKCLKRPKPFNSSRYLYEPKLDGYRLKVENGDTTLDGEVAVLDAAGVPRLRLVQQRGKSDPGFLRNAMRDYPAIFYPFDILKHKRKDLESLSTIERKHILAEVAPTLKRNGIKCYSSGGHDITDRFPEMQDPAGYKLLPYIVGEGIPLYNKLCEAGWEGMVAKPLDAPYVYDNRSLWLKIKKPRIEGKFQVCGGCYPRPDSNREGWVGSVILGEVTPKGLIYRGEVGTGFDFTELARLTSDLKRQDACPFTSRVKPERFWFWCKPTLTLEVDFFERTADDMLREPVVKRILW